MSEGYRSGEDVRAEVIIHDTDKMKAAGLKALSLGYNLDLEETPGMWNGQHYDAIQRNIRINHLALVADARAGERARLNIDSRDAKNSKGAQGMKKTRKTTHGDSILTDEELAKAIEDYKKRRAQSAVAKEDADEPEKEVPVVSAEPENVPEKAEPKPDAEDDADAITSKVEAVKANKEQRAQEGAPDDNKKAVGVISQMDEDMGILFDIIDTLLAERDFGKKTASADCEDVHRDELPDELEKLNKDDDDEIDTQDEDSEDDEENAVKPTVAEDDDEEEAAAPFAAKDKQDKVNMDSIDRVVRQRVKLGMIGQKLNLDGLENLSIKSAQKAIIQAVRPGIRLDGKSDAYISAAFDMACEEIDKKTSNSTNVQKAQMFNKKNRMDAAASDDSATKARDRMIERQNKKED